MYLLWIRYGPVVFRGGLLTDSNFGLNVLAESGVNLVSARVSQGLSCCLVVRESYVLIMLICA